MSTNKTPTPQSALALDWNNASSSDFSENDGKEANIKNDTKMQIP